MLMSSHQALSMGKRCNKRSFVHASNLGKIQRDFSLLAMLGEWVGVASPGRVLLFLRERRCWRFALTHTALLSGAFHSLDNNGKPYGWAAPIEVGLA